MESSFMLPWVDISHTKFSQIATDGRVTLSDWGNARLLSVICSRSSTPSPSANCKVLFFSTVIVADKVGDRSAVIIKIWRIMSSA